MAGEILVEDDDIAHVSYFPPNAWDHGASSFRDRFHGMSYHVTHVADAYVLFVFNGSYVAYYSDLNGNHGPFEIHLDGKPHDTGSSYSDTWEAPKMLFSTDVEPGMHTLVIQNPSQTDTGDIWLGVDYFIYRPLPETPSTQSENEQAPNPRSNRPIVAAIVAPICAVLALILLFFAVVFMRRRGRRRSDGLKPLAPPPLQSVAPPPAYAKLFEKSPVAVVRAA
ncbi:hypothetical protein AURDEDRAFT_123929 [Auricularia subglabra TFB-10046 SS5]|nr:hypothetical protein AURDEDRAFT_123929 [Auricularia subglabra TFB-10046 SS5]